MSLACSFTLISAILGIYGCQGVSDVADYILWQKKEIVMWDQYFPSRMLRQEYLITEVAAIASSSIFSGINSSLSRVVAFQQQEIQTAEQLMAGTEAEGCVAGIADYINTVIDREVSTYNDCTADVLPNLSRFNRTLNDLRSRYKAAYQRVLNGIDACAKIYPNKDFADRLRACVSAMTNRYYIVSNATLRALSPSPAMSYFTQTVVECASTAASNVADEGWQFLKLLLYCASLSDINITTYAEELSQWEGYNDTLPRQVSDAQLKNLIQMMMIKNEIQSYFDLQRQVIAKYVIGSRDVSYYQNKTKVYLSDYYAKVNEAFLYNPHNTTCALNALEDLDNIVNLGANKSLACDVTIVNDTVQVINQIDDNYLLLNQLMPEAGDVAILNCFAKGYVFAPNTINMCFQLAYIKFDADHDDIQSAITQDKTTLSSYMNTLFNSSWLPCGTNLKRNLLSANRTLYQLKSCLYKEFEINDQTTTSIPTSLFTTSNTRNITEYASSPTTLETSIAITTTTQSTSVTTDSKTIFTTTISQSTYPEPTITIPEPPSSSTSAEPTTSPEPTITPSSSTSAEPTTSPEPTTTPSSSTSAEPTTSPEPTITPSSSTTAEPKSSSESTITPSTSFTTEPTISSEATITLSSYFTTEQTTTSSTEPTYRTTSTSYTDVTTASTEPTYTAASTSYTDVTTSSAEPTYTAASTSYTDVTTSSTELTYTAASTSYTDVTTASADTSITPSSSSSTVKTRTSTTTGRATTTAINTTHRRKSNTTTLRPSTHGRDKSSTTSVSTTTQKRRTTTVTSTTHKRKHRTTTKSVPFKRYSQPWYERLFYNIFKF